MTLLEEIASRSEKLRYSDIPAEAIEMAKMGILDTFGVMLAGTVEEGSVILRKVLGRQGAEGPATLFGTQQKTSPLDAAMINGMAAHALALDDVTNNLGGHPSSSLLPGLWALAESRGGVTGRELLLAYVVGFEVMTKLARAVNFYHYEKGWHPSATLGVFGSTAACAKLLGLEPGKFASALGTATSLASGVKANFGTMTKPLCLGHASRNGLLAALLAEEGMTGSRDALEHSQGFFEVFNGAGNYHAERILETWASPFELVEPGVAIKRYSCCASTHAAIDGVLALRKEHGIDAKNVVSIESWVHPRRIKHSNKPDPRTGLEGKYSVQYILSRAAMDGDVKVEHFTDEAVLDPEVRKFMPRVKPNIHPDAKVGPDESFYAEVKITTDLGEAFNTFIDRPLGRDRQHPLPPGAFEAKFRDMAGIVQDKASIEKLAEALKSLDALKDIRIVGDIMRAGNRSATSASAAGERRAALAS